MEGATGRSLRAGLVPRDQFQGISEVVGYLVGTPQERSSFLHEGFFSSLLGPCEVAYCQFRLGWGPCRSWSPAPLFTGEVEYTELGGVLILVLLPTQPEPPDFFWVARTFHLLVKLVSFPSLGSGQV